MKIVLIFSVFLFFFTIHPKKTVSFRKSDTHSFEKNDTLHRFCYSGKLNQVVRLISALNRETLFLESDEATFLSAKIQAGQLVVKLLNTYLYNLDLAEKKAPKPGHLMFAQVSKCQ